MNDHPAVLTAVTAAWSTAKAWAAYRDLDTDHTPLRSPTYGTINARGGHGDPTANATVHHAGLNERVREHVTTAWWLTTSANRQAPTTTGPALRLLPRLLAQVPPATAAEAGRYLHHADRALRRALNIGPDASEVIGNPRCPACQQRRLIIHTAAPRYADRTITCTNQECRCTGPLCPCGMTVRENRTPHIWPVTAAIPVTA